MHHPLHRLSVVLAVEAAGLAWLVRLGQRPWLSIKWSDLRRWAETTPVEDAVAAVIWLAALICAIWVTLSTLLYLVALVSRVPSFIRSVSWLTLPAIRKVGEAALAAFLVTTTTLPSPVGAFSPPPVTVMVDDEGQFLPPGISLPDGGRVPPLPALPHEQTEQPLLHALSTRSRPSAPPIADGTEEVEEPLSDPVHVTVQTGDNLWSISRRHLTAAFGQPPANEHVVPYWRQVIEINRPHLISGNPDLIYPGEVLTMPATN